MCDNVLVCLKLSKLVIHIDPESTISRSVFANPERRVSRFVLAQTLDSGVQRGQLTSEMSTSF